MSEQNEQGAMTEPVVDMMKQGLAVMRVENETLQAMAIQRPRDIAKLAKSAIDELRAFPEFAKRAYYSIPYKDRNSASGTTMVEGPSIKAANAILRHWGNNSSGFRIVGSDEERIHVQGVFVDHETGMRRTAEISVPRMARASAKDGKPAYYYPLAADRLNMAVQAAGSKAVRNAALNALPIGLVEAYFAEAKKIAGRGGKVYDGPAKQEDISGTQETLLKSFETLGVERSEVAGLINRNTEICSDEEATNAFLQGILTALQEGQTTIEEVFTVPTSEQPMTEPQRKAQEPAKEAPNAQARPTDWKRMKAAYKGKCATCKLDITKGDDILYNGKAKETHHVKHFA